LLHDLVSSATPARENQRQNFLFEKTRDSQEKKEILILINSNQDLFFSSLLCPPPLSAAAAQRSSSRLRSARAGNQRTAVPAPPVLGTRERPCPFRPCRGPESGRPGGTGPSGGPHAGNPAGFLEFTHLLTYT
jgi:hypothetical protein